MYCHFTCFFFKTKRDDWYFGKINRCLPLKCESKPIDFHWQTSSKAGMRMWLLLFLDVIVDCFQFVIYDFCFCRLLFNYYAGSVGCFHFCLSHFPYIQMKNGLLVRLSVRSRYNFFNSITLNKNCFGFIANPLFAFWLLVHIQLTSWKLESESGQKSKIT